MTTRARRPIQIMMTYFKPLPRRLASLAGRFEEAWEL